MPTRIVKLCCAAVLQSTIRGCNCGGGYNLAPAPDLLCDDKVNNVYGFALRVILATILVSFELIEEGKRWIGRVVLYVVLHLGGYIFAPDGISG
ncbi:unnamed protein product [Phytophthora fragariaefolia]|uniref:Unnamed protein product n=1 Tax=Phytophthora fragariaefolia TaxID=1490495 RepID=A0A9W6Y6U5_9STRA|nr:unnamed protein product [Phytophthora fragariaefolia]